MTKSLKEKCKKREESAKVNREKDKGGSSTITLCPIFQHLSASSFLHAFGPFDWGKVRQDDSIDLYCIGGDLSYSKGKDSHLLGMEDCGLINPSCTGGGNGSHGEDHGGDLLINSEGELINEMEFLFYSCFEQKVLEVGDITFEPIIHGSVVFLERSLHEFGELGAGGGFGIEGVEGGLKVLDEFVKHFLRVHD